jgi:hypothetical protein
MFGRAGALVKTGVVISLTVPLDGQQPGETAPKRREGVGRGTLKRTVISRNAVRGLRDGRFVVINDDRVEFALQGSSQWDSLAHVGLIESGSTAVFYGGRDLREVGPEGEATSLGIENYAGGIVSRGVMFDMVDYFGNRDAEYVVDGTRIMDTHIEDYLKKHALTLDPGDIVLIYTGVQRLLEATGGAYPRKLAGLDGSTNRIWGDARIAAIACDNPTPEATPPLDWNIHIGALRNLGILLGELWSLEALAKACRADGRYECLLVSSPLNIPGAFGSPPNAVAIR